MEILKAEHLLKVYGENETRVVAINDISLTVQKGEFVAIVGASGSGKSTLLHILGGVDAPTKGRVLIDGEDVYSLKDEKRSILRRRKVGFIFQEYNLLPILTVEENIKMPLSLDGKKPEEAYINEIIQTLGLEERRTHLPNQLSGGQQQRVAIGRALANRPSIIFADEPTGNLDKKNGYEVLSLLKKSLEKFSQTLVLITHDIEIANMADRIIRIEDGKIIQDEVRKHD